MTTRCLAVTNGGSSSDMWQIKADQLAFGRTYLLTLTTGEHNAQNAENSGVFVKAA